ncbi:CubicO group peptidase, beta-lactamase class C family [Georgenia satyanarayanai]|uniref:CubicO group peptidase, beta-lactamase class C family n=1 Tax=Georgenia satyanarayanai TaxID=860221 RepID=A0A2Y8ZZG4_9MICO|nr:serine hydrolase domain-containing protein [Georgenia satyanarayanai]PYG02177.1 CubicO group peptidase (beta-lactamase class C family) [Georgenia satyanarayanai]SSA36996.1 CubicO group peptidase, beta-lactamase class C family [Georgenia satyanarayanai]
MPTQTRHGTAQRIALALAGVAATLAACGTAPEATPPSPEQPGASAAPLERSDVDAWLDQTLPAALEEGNIAGATVAVVHDGEIVTSRGFGEADVDAGMPVDPDRTLFRVGSVSKLFTATAVMQLVESGEVDLDTDVEQYTGLDLGLQHPVTLRHLLTHTPGFEERITGLIGTDTTPDLRDSLVTDPPEQVFEPGTTPAYSNYGNALAGYVVEAVSGMPFEEYVAAHVLEPAGMTSSSFAQPLPDHLAADVALGYPTAEEDPLPFEVVGQPPAGALSGTATDMARFMLAHLGHPAGDQEILSPATRALMMEPALDADALGILAQGPRMGLGWFDESRHGHRVVGHGGDTTAFHSHLQLWPDDGTGLYLSLSSTGTDGAAYLLRDELLDAFADRYYPGPGATESTVPADVREEHAQALAGAYESTRGFHSTFLTATGPLQPTRAVVVDGDRVRFTPGPGQLGAAEYTEIEPWVYQQVGGHRVLTVRADDAGQVEMIGHDSAMSMVPVGAARSASIPALAGGAAVLLLTALAWPVGAAMRRVRARRRTAAVGNDGAAPGPREAAGAPAPVRLPRRLTRLAAVVTVVALAGWAYVLIAVMNLQPVPELLVRAVQVTTAVGVLGLLAAGWRVVAEVRARTGWVRIGTASVLLLAFAATSMAVNQLLLLSPDITY